MNEAHLFDMYLSNFKEIYAISHNNLCKYRNFQFVIHFLNGSFWIEEYDFAGRIYVDIYGTKEEDRTFETFSYLIYNRIIFYRSDLSPIKRHNWERHTIFSETDIFLTRCDINMDDYVSSYYCHIFKTKLVELLLLFRRAYKWKTFREEVEKFNQFDINFIY